MSKEARNLGDTFDKALLSRSELVERLNKTRTDQFSYALTDSQCIIQASQGFYFLLKNPETEESYLMHCHYADTPNGLKFISGNDIKRDETIAENQDGLRTYVAGKDEDPRYFKTAIFGSMDKKTAINETPQIDKMRVVAGRPSGEADDWIMHTIIEDQKQLYDIGLSIHTLSHVGDNVFTNATGLYQIKENEEGAYDVHFYTNGSINKHEFGDEDNLNNWLSQIGSLKIATAGNMASARREMMSHAYEKLPQHLGETPRIDLTKIFNDQAGLKDDIQLNLMQRVRNVSKWLKEGSARHKLLYAGEKTARAAALISEGINKYLLPTGWIETAGGAVADYLQNKRETTQENGNGKESPNKDIRYNGLNKDKILEEQSLWHGSFLQKKLHKLLGLQQDQMVPKHFYAEPDPALLENCIMAPFTQHEDIASFEFSPALDCKERYLKWLYNGIEGADIQSAWPSNDGAVTFLGSNGLITDHLPDEERVMVRLDEFLKDEEKEKLPPMIQDMLAPLKNQPDEQCYAFEVRKTEDGRYKTKPLTVRGFQMEMYKSTGNRKWAEKGWKDETIRPDDTAKPSSAPPS